MNRHSSSTRPASSATDPATELLEAYSEAAAICDAAGVPHTINGAWIERLGLQQAHGAPPLTHLLASGVDAAESLSEALQRRNGNVSLAITLPSGGCWRCTLRLRPLGRHDMLAVLVDEERYFRLLDASTSRLEILHRERETIRAVAESIDQGVLVADDSDRVLLLNPMAQRILGLPARGVLLNHVNSLPIAAAVRGAWLTFLASDRETAVQSARLVRDGGSTTLLLRLRRLYSADRVPVASVMVLQDLSAQVDAAGDRGDLIGQILHELELPLQSASSFAEALRSDEALAPELRGELVAALNAQTRCALDLVGRIRELTELDDEARVMSRTQVSLGALITTLAATHGQQIECAAPEGVAVWADETLLRRALEQLIENAIRYGDGARRMRIAVERVGSVARVSVRDHGNGVPAEDLERIFDPFHRLSTRSDAAGGPLALGLGLPLARQIARRHGGSLHAELPIGGGLRLVFELPAI